MGTTIQIEENTILLPLTIGVGAIVFTIGIHALALTTIIRLICHERRLGRAGASFSINMTIITVGILLALSAHLTEMVLWAGIFEACAEFPTFATAFYHSAVNYTTLGYGDIMMSHRWRFLAPLEATDGMLMFGISTAMIFTVILRIGADEVSRPSGLRHLLLQCYKMPTARSMLERVIWHG